ncbi:hypothetical protein B484DRAFT_444687 [Ochromonadaceae sp. CCMP2298]|nr:hypothetical protein B484DRAFT_444687 [Ochromonadaceae sp. CCMP2298]
MATSMAKLKAEAAAPFRFFRTFVYAGIGAAGGLGLFTAVPQLILATADDKQNAVINVAVDLGGVVAAALLWSKEQAQQAKLESSYEVKQAKMDNKISTLVLVQRERQLGMLPVRIQTSERDENVTRIVSLADLQAKGGQHVVLVAGEVGFVRDAMITARLEGVDLFVSRETVVVPFVYNDRQLEEGKDKGFAKSQDKDALMTSPYIARPQQLEVWQSVLQNEVDLAEQQGAQGVWQQGLVVSLAKTGKVVRRGLGAPPWKEVVQELVDGKAKDTKK